MLAINTPTPRMPLVASLIASALAFDGDDYAAIDFATALHAVPEDEKRLISIEVAIRLDALRNTTRYTKKRKKMSKLMLSDWGAVVVANWAARLQVIDTPMGVVFDAAEFLARL